MSFQISPAIEYQCQTVFFGSKDTKMYIAYGLVSDVTLHTYNIATGWKQGSRQCGREDWQAVRNK